jgi:ATP-dependent DNA ligase
MPKAPKPEGFPDEDANWIEPTLVCVVKYMMKTSNGGLRQPVFKGLRFDKLATECVEKST